METNTLQRAEELQAEAVQQRMAYYDAEGIPEPYDRHMLEIGPKRETLEAAQCLIGESDLSAVAKEALGAIAVERYQRAIEHVVSTGGNEFGFEEGGLHGHSD